MGPQHSSTRDCCPRIPDGDALTHSATHPFVCGDRYEVSEVQVFAARQRCGSITHHIVLLKLTPRMIVAVAVRASRESSGNVVICWGHNIVKSER